MITSVLRGFYKRNTHTHANTHTLKHTPADSKRERKESSPLCNTGINKHYKIFTHTLKKSDYFGVTWTNTHSHTHTNKHKHTHTEVIIHVTLTLINTNMHKCYKHYF